MVKVTFEHDWGEKWLFTNWDTQDKTGPESLPREVIVIGLTSEAGHPPSCQLCSGWDKGTRGLGEELVGAIKAASELEKALPKSQEGNSCFLSACLQRWATLQPQGSLNGPRLLPHLLGETSWSLDLRTEYATFSWSPCPEDRKEAKWMVRSQTRKKYMLQNKYVLFDVGFYLFSFKPQTFQNLTAGVRRVSN